ncbi:MAG: hypothetical protein ACUVYA_18745 [Planctomycetota bacterium]
MAPFDYGLDDRAIRPEDRKRDNPTLAHSLDVAADAENAVPEGLDRSPLDRRGCREESEEDRQVPGRSDEGDVGFAGEEFGTRQEVVVEPAFVFLDVGLEGAPLDGEPTL